MPQRLGHAAEGAVAWSRRWLAGVVGARGSPRHVALIMDGNRRFAERLALPTMEGHSFGYSKLLEAFEWCLQLGVQCVSVYAFSVDNFKRSALEVETLMDLACAKFALMMDQQSSLRSQGVRVCVLGRLDLLPADVREAAERVVDATKDYTGPRLNICFAYSSAIEMLAGAEARTAGLEEDEADDFNDYLYTKGCSEVDLVIRTSGEDRLSDFLLWQSRHALLVFSPQLWPDFSFTGLLQAVVRWQRARPSLHAAREACRVRVAGRGTAWANALPATPLCVVGGEARARRNSSGEEEAECAASTSPSDSALPAPIQTSSHAWGSEADAEPSSPRSVTSGPHHGSVPSDDDASASLDDKGSWTARGEAEELVLCLEGVGVADAETRCLMCARVPSLPLALG